MRAQDAAFWMGMLLLLSGCTSSTGTGAAAPAPSTSGGLGADPVEADSAVLNGIVVDPEVVPIAGAEVTLVPSADSGRDRIVLRADDFGAFSVSALAPGPYVVKAAAPGFHDSKPTPLQVRPNDDVKLTVTLEPFPKAVARHESTPYKFTSKDTYCYTTPVHPRSCGSSTSGSTSAKVLVDEFVVGTLQSLLVEGKVNSPMAACPGGVRLDVWSPEEKQTSKNLTLAPYHWHNMPYDGTARIFIPRNGADEAAMHSAARSAAHQGKPIETTGTWQFGFSPEAKPTTGAVVDVGCGLDYSVELFVTRFYVEAGAPDFTMFP